MYRFDRLIEEAEELLKSDLEGFLKGVLDSVTVYARRYVEMIEDKVIGVRRPYELSLRKLPFVVVGLSELSESVVSFGFSSIGSVKIVEINLNVGTVLNLKGKNLWLYDFDYDRVIKLNFFDVMFRDVGNVMREEFIEVVNRQLPALWRCEEKDDGVVIYSMGTNKVKILKGSDFGLEDGSVIVGKVYDYKGFVMDVGYEIMIGAESAQVRNDMLNLVYMYFEKGREKGVVIGRSDFSMSIGSGVRVGGLREERMEGTDPLNFLYMGGVSGRLVLSVNDVEGRELEVVSGVNGFGNVLGDC